MNFKFKNASNGAIFESTNKRLEDWSVSTDDTLGEILAIVSISAYRVLCIAVPS